MLSSIASIVAAGWLATIAWKPLKLSSEYRFKRTGWLFEGLFYLGGAIVTIISPFWIVPFAFTAGVSYLIKKRKNDTYYLSE